MKKNKISKETKRIAKQGIKADVIIELNKIVTKFGPSKKAKGIITKTANKLAKILSKEIKPLVIEETQSSVLDIHVEKKPSATKTRTVNKPIKEKQS